MEQLAYQLFRSKLYSFNSEWIDQLLCKVSIGQSLVDRISDIETEYLLDAFVVSVDDYDRLETQYHWEELLEEEKASQ